MKKNKKNRREFLKLAGLSAIGVVVVSSGVKTTAETSITARQMSFEDWVLQTGADKLPPDLRQVLSTQSKK